MRWQCPLLRLVALTTASHSAVFIPERWHAGTVTIDPDIAARAIQHDPERAGALLAVLRSVDEGDLRADGPVGTADGAATARCSGGLSSHAPGARFEVVESRMPDAGSR